MPGDILFECPLCGCQFLNSQKATPLAEVVTILNSKLKR